MTLNGKEIIKVEVPKGSNEINVFNTPPDPHIEWCDDLRNFDCVILPKGNWKILGRPSEISEEVARGLVQPVEVAGGNRGRDFGYVNYSHDAQHDFSTATESLRSWCKANGITDKHILLIEK